MRSLKFLSFLIVSLSLNQTSSAQTIPTVEEVHNFFNNQNMLITSRDGGPIYGTFYFLEIHYCPQGYGLYGRSEKQTVMGNTQRNNWQEFGTWKAMEQNGAVGLYYAVASTEQSNFVPVYKMPNGNFTIGEGYTIVHQGQAICQ